MPMRSSILRLQCYRVPGDQDVSCVPADAEDAQPWESLEELDFGHAAVAGLLVWLVLAAALLALRTWQQKAGAGLRKRARADGGANGGSGGCWNLGLGMASRGPAATLAGAAAAAALFVIVLLAAGGSARRRHSAAGSGSTGGGGRGEAYARAAARATVPGGGAATVVTTTTVRSGRASVTTTQVLDTIFVSVASYRDPECHNTVADLFRQAEFPQRVFVAAVEQNKERNESCIDSTLPGFANVRVVAIPHTASKGPTYGRYLAGTVYRGETFYMQLDSHTQLAPKWDSKLIAMLDTCDSPKPILTTYPPDLPDRGVTDETPVLCGSHWSERSILTFTAAKMRPAARPRPVPFTAAGFVFTRGSLLREVPFDPHLEHLFNGEEILFSARAWTHGYDFFSPSENLCWHMYVTPETEGRFGHRPKYWEDIPEFFQLEKRVEDKVRFMLGWQQQRPDGIEVNYERYGFGTARTLAQYWAFAAVTLPGTRNATDPGSTASDPKFCPPLTAAEISEDQARAEARARAQG